MNTVALPTLAAYPQAVSFLVAPWLGAAAVLVLMQSAACEKHKNKPG